MIFDENTIKKIIRGEKTQIRKLVKEGELEFQEPCRVETYLGRVKWCIVRKYAVCPGRGKKQVWYCPSCKAIKGTQNILDTIRESKFCIYCELLSKKNNWKPLFIKITKIKKENLLDITRTNIKKEGFKNRKEFLDDFKKHSKITNSALHSFNTKVWVLSFEVVK